MMSYYNNLLMIKRTSIFILCTVLLSSCHFRNIISEEEYITIDKLVLDLDVDWSELDTPPTGMTLALYPIDETDPEAETEGHVYHFNTVDHVTLSVPMGDYSIVCMNQSEEEFAAFTFDLSTFNKASVTVREDGTSTKANVRYGTGSTRGLSIQGTLMPGSLAVGTMNSVMSETKRRTRGLSVQGVLIPSNVVKGLSLEVNAFGLNETVKVRGTLTNLAGALSMRSLKPIGRAMDQELEPEMWTMTLPTDKTKPGKVSCTFGTFGPFVLPEPENDPFTRGALDEGDGENSPAPETAEDVKCMLLMDLEMNDGTHFSKVLDMTEFIFQNFVKEDKDEATFVVGSSTDTGGSSDLTVDGETEQGTFILHNTDNVGKTTVSVEGWTKINNIDVNF